MRRVVLKSPVLENCTPGSVRGAPGNRRPYLASIKDKQTEAVPIYKLPPDSVPLAPTSPSCVHRVNRKS